MEPPDFESRGGSCSFFHFFYFIKKVKAAFDLYGKITLYRVIAVRRGVLGSTSRPEKSGFLADWFKTVFMEDSENGGKGEMQERNRTVVYLPR